MAKATLLDRLLCRLGLHDFEVVEVTMGFGFAGSVEKVVCRRCGLATTRPAKKE